MPRSVVCDAGGLLVVAGALDGRFPVDAEILALDWAMITVGRFLAARFDGRPERITAEIGLAAAAVHEWFPVRTLVADTIDRAGLDAVDALDSWSAVLLGEHLELPVLTANDDVTSDVIEIYRPW